MFSRDVLRWKTVTVASTPENWARNWPRNHGKAYSLRDSKDTIEIDVPISEIVVFAIEIDVN